MNSMSYMEKLLDGVEVKWKALGDVAVINTGQKPSEILDNASNFDYINAGTSRSGYSASSNCEGDTVTTPSRGQGGIGYVGYQRDPFWLGPLCYKIKSIDNAFLINKYIFYFFQSKSELLLGLKKEGGVPAVNKSDLVRLEIPIPCPENPKKSLEIQTEIVRILDTFTELATELTAELIARKKQYNYYRDQLLSFEEREVEWKALGELAKIKNGKDWKRLGAGDIPVYGSGGVMKYVDTFVYDKPTVLIPRKGSITNIFYVESPFWNVDTIYYTEIDTGQIIPKFFYYFMKTIDMMQLDTGSGRPSLTQAILNQIKVPVPTLTNQARIVSILDKFDTLTTSITEGLPREIALRQQQYEYYRDLLLSFPKPDSEVAA